MKKHWILGLVLGSFLLSLFSPGWGQIWIIGTDEDGWTDYGSPGWEGSMDDSIVEVEDLSPRDMGSFNITLASIEHDFTDLVAYIAISDAGYQLVDNDQVDVYAGIYKSGALIGSEKELSFSNLGTPLTPHAPYGDLQYEEIVLKDTDGSKLTIVEYPVTKWPEPGIGPGYSASDVRAAKSDNGPDSYIDIVLRFETQADAPVESFYIHVDVFGCRVTTPGISQVETASNGITSNCGTSPNSKDITGIISIVPVVPYGLGGILGVGLPALGFFLWKRKT